MSAVKVKKHVSYSISHNDLELELTFGPDNEPIIKENESKIVVGYLVHDGDCQNPLEDCDGMGHIYSLSRKHINHISLEEAEEKLKNDPWCVPLSYFEHGLCLWDVQGGPRISNCPDMRWDGVTFAGVWEPDSECRSHIESSSIFKLIPDTVKVNYQPKGDVINVITLTMPDGSIHAPYKSFESAYRAAAHKLGIKIDKTTKDKAAYQLALECAEQACETYSSWCNGDYHGVCVDVFNKSGEKVSDDACWGFIGFEYAEKELNDRINSELK